MSTTTGSPGWITRSATLVVRAGAVGPAADDDEVDGGVALGEDRVGDVAADLALGAARPQPLPHPRVHPVDGGGRLAQRLDLLRRLAHPQLAQHDLPRAPARPRASPRAAAAPSRPTCGRRGRPPRPRAAVRPPGRTGRRSRPSPGSRPPDPAAATPRPRAARGPGTTTRTGPSAGTHQAGEPLQRDRVVAGEVAQVGAGRHEQPVQLGCGDGAAGLGPGVRRSRRCRQSPAHRMPAAAGWRCAR